MTPSFEYRDGEFVEVEDVIISTDTELTGDITRTVVITDGAEVRILGTVKATVHLDHGSLEIVGSIHGTLRVAEGQAVRIAGEQHGTVHLARDARLTILPQRELRGTLRNDGLLINRGRRGGAVSGSGRYIDELGGQVIQGRVETMPDGSVIHIYES